MVNWALLAGLLIPNIVGWLGTLTMIGQVDRKDGQAWCQLLKKPTWKPPTWIFGPMWTTVYFLMGYASYLVFETACGFTQQAIIPLSLYGGQLILNWTWTPVFFGLHNLKLSFFHILAVDAAAVASTISFMFVNSTAGYLMLPYLGWLGVVSFLSYNVWQFNKDDITSA
ncbi:hypothetical protein ABMA27_009639 [Loxostege sticticalis]|uniref:Translocator protein n=1 Tax=Loxostege sticticalis TaxID=481309 RepID=A0ABR3H8M5_LOXSC